MISYQYLISVGPAPNTPSNQLFEVVVVALTLHGLPEQSTTHMIMAVPGTAALCYSL